jgi:hypothetical protein
VSDGRRTALSVGAGSVAVVVVLLLGGYAFGWGWTGYRNQTGEVNKLWDWLTLLLQPLTLALLPLWLRSGARRRRDWLVLGTAAAVVFLVLVVGGYRLGWSWTGFAGNTLWDWLKLFLMPFLLPLVLLLMVPAEEDHTVLVPPTPAPPPARRSSVSPLVAAVAAALVAGVLVAAGFGLGRGAGTPYAADSAGGAGQASIVQRVMVTARDPYWTDTAVAVRRGERVTVTASGRVLAHPSWPWAGPTGRNHAGARSMRPGLPHVALLAMVGRPGAAIRLDSPRGAGSAMLVGSHRTLDMPADGELFLGVNDRKTSDNSGYFAAQLILAGR